MNKLNVDKIFLGSVEQIFPPSDKNNYYNYQYVYRVKVTLDKYSQLPVNCILSEKYGSANNFDDHILEVNSRVLVTFVNNDTTLGIIIGAIRLHGEKVDPSLGQHYKKRYNNVEEYISKDNNYSLSSLIGNTVIQLNTNSIILDDASGDKITIDKDNKKITIECETWNVEVKGNATINVAGNTNISSQGNIDINSSGNINVSSTGLTQVVAPLITLNGPTGSVLTDNLNPVVDLITGVPSVGVPTVKSG